MKKYENTSKIIKAPYNKDHPYTVVSNNWNNYEKLNGYERAIMLEIMTNDSENFTIVKSVIQDRLKFPRQKFYDAWDSLEAKYFILCDKKKKYGVHWVVNERNGMQINDTGIATRGNPSRGNPSLSNLISNKEISNKETSLESLVLKGDNRTNTISNADAFDSILDGASAPELYTKANFVFNIQEMDMPSIDFNSDLELL